MAHTPVAGTGHDSALARPTVTVTLERVANPAESKGGLDGKGSAHGSGRVTPPLEDADGKGSDAGSNPGSPRNVPANPHRSPNLNLSATNPNLETGVFVTIGKSRFYFRHLKNGEEMAHTKEEWNQLISSQIKRAFAKLPEDRGNAGFDVEQHKRLEIDLSAATVTCTPQAEDLPPQTYRVGAKAQSFFQALTTTLQARPGISMQHPAARGTLIQAPFNQAGSSLGETAKHACTAIAGEFIQTALFYRDGRYLNPNFLRHCIEQGQQNYLGVIKKDIEDNDEWTPDQNRLIDFADLDDDLYALLMQTEMPVQADIPMQSGTAFYKRILNELTTREDLPPDEPIAAGVTCRGESYALVLYRDPTDQTKIKEVVYFDSHGHARENGTPNGCAISFKNIDDAAAFLAHRSPYLASEDPMKNKISFTLMYRREDWSNLFKAQRKYLDASHKAQLDNDDAADRQAAQEREQAAAALKRAALVVLDGNPEGVAPNNRVKESIALALTGGRDTATGKMRMREEDPTRYFADPELELTAFALFQRGLKDKRLSDIPAIKNPRRVQIVHPEDSVSDDEQA